MSQFLQIDEQGLVFDQGEVIQNRELGQSLLANLALRHSQIVTKWDDEGERLVEAFDAPLVAHAVKNGPGLSWQFVGPYGFKASFDLSGLTLDGFDRFRGFTQNNVPFVLSPHAQNQLFDLVEEYGDNSLTYAGQEIPTLNWYLPHPEVASSKFWSQRYQQGTTPWELNAPAPALREQLPKLKVPRSRVLVIGAGSSHDAAFFAQAGHLVTAVDFAPEAIALAKSQFSGLQNLEFVEANCFHLSSEFHKTFDLIFEHTCFCAIPPESRQDLINVWKRCLAPRGQLLSIFYVHPLRSGPPYGVTEWEVREHLKPGFQILNWQRIRSSVPQRIGNELWVHAILS